MTSNPWLNKRVLITGVCGTVGKELLKQVMRRNLAEVIGLDNRESELFFLSENYRNHTNAHFYLGDVRDRNKLTDKMGSVDIVLHAAAYKHVILCEQSPRDAIQTNILGTQNVIDAAIANKVERVIFTSSDKAVNPTNVMGTSKLMCERLMTAANAYRRGDGPIFTSTRFGNVLGSRGSVIPLFKNQIMQGGPVTLTDPSMTRFIMTIQEAVRLVMESTFLGFGGEVFITKMPSIRIQDLASVMIEELALELGHDTSEIEIKIIGSRPGEKLYEELMTDEETHRAVDLKSYYVVLPAFKSVYKNIIYEYPDMNGDAMINHAYNSKISQMLNKKEIAEFLKNNGLLY